MDWSKVLCPAEKTHEDLELEEMMTIAGTEATGDAINVIRGIRKTIIKVETRIKD